MDEKLNVLIVEDEVLIANQTEMAIQKLGHRITCKATSGKEALETLKEQKPDLILMDINIDGDTDGIETAAKINQKYDIPIIFLIAFSDNEFIQQIKKVSPYGYLVRPIRSDNLAIRIEIAIFKYKAEQQLKLANQQLEQERKQRKQAEASLLESQQRFKDIYFSLGEWVWEIDTQGKFIFSVGKINDTLGYSQEEIIGTPLFDFMHAQEAKRISTILKNLQQKNKPIQNLENWCINKDGADICLMTNGIPVFDSNGNLNGYRGVCKNITENKKAEQALIESEEKYRLSFDKAEVLISIYDYNGTCLLMNNMVAALFGGNPDDFIGKSFAQLHPESEKEYTCRIQEAISTGIAKEYEDEVAFSKGKRYLLSKVHPIRDGQGRIYAAQIISQDITERKKAEENLKVSEKKYRAVVENANEGILVVQDWVRKYYNPQWLEFTGYSPEEYEKIPFLSLIHPDDLPGIKKDLEEFVNNGKLPPNQTFKLIDKMNRTKWLYLKTSQVIWEGKPALMGLYHDITERKLAEEALKESEEKYRNLFSFAPNFITVVDHNYIIIDINKVVPGLKKEDIIGTKVHVFVNPDYHDIMEKSIKEVFETGKNGMYSSMASGPDGTNAFYDNYLSAYKKNGKTISVTIVGVDVTKQKQTDIALKESDERFELAMKATKDGLYDWNLITNEIYYSPGWKSILGYKYDELPNDFSIWETHTDPEDVKRSWKMQQELINKQRDRFEMEFKMKHKDGHWVDILSRATAILDDSGKAVRIVGTHVDISERKKMEKNIKEREAIFSELFNTMPSGVAIYKVINDGKSGKDYIIKDFNKTSLKIEGLEKKDVIGKSLLDLRPNIDDYGLIPILREVWKTGNPAFYPAKIYVDKNYANYYENRVFKLPSGEIVAIYDDVTERMETQEKMILHHRVYQSMAESVIISDVNAITIDVNPAAEKLLGWKKEEMIGKTAEMLNPPDRAPEILENILTGLEKDGLWKGELPIVTKSGQYKTFNTFVSSLYDNDGKKIGSIGISRDITKRKKAEEALRISEEKYRNLYENSPFGIIICELLRDDKGKAIDFIHCQGNSAVTVNTGFILGKLIGKKATEIIEVEKARELTERYEKVVLSGEILNYIEYFGVYDKTLQVSAFHLQGDKFIINFIDVTDQKKAEKELRKSEKKFRALFEQTGGYCMILDPNTPDGIPRIIDANNAACQMHGYTREEFIGRPVTDIDDEEGKKLCKYRTGLIMTGEPFYVENMHVRKDGSTFQVAVNAQRIDLDDDYPLIFTTEYDITERKRAEEALAEKTNFLDKIIESSALSTWISDEKGTIIKANPACLAFFGATEKEVIGKYNLFKDIVLQKKGFIEKIEKVFEKGEVANIIIDYDFAAVDHVNVKNATHKIINTIFTPILNSNGKVSNVIVQSIDLTEIKKAEKKLKAALQEKIVLLQEVHHRVKNNMQIISAILELQINKIDDEKYLQIIKEVENRVYSMSIIHEMFYRAKDFAKIDFTYYIETLVSNLFMTYGMYSDKVTYQIESENAFLGLDTAIPCGLLLNELISNSLKHAFPNDREGTIKISLKKKKKNFELIYSDDGIGMAKQFDVSQSDTLGCTLITGLVGQMDGDMKISTERGTIFTVTFPIKIEEEINE